MAEASTWAHRQAPSCPVLLADLSLDSWDLHSAPFVSPSITVTCCFSPPQLGPEMAGGGSFSLPAFSAQAKLSPGGAGPLRTSQVSLALPSPGCWART